MGNNGDDRWISSAAHYSSSAYRCSMLLSFVFHWPTALSMAWAFSRQPVALLSSVSLLQFVAELLIFDMLLRAARLVAILLHEGSHLLAATLLIRGYTREDRAAVDNFEVSPPLRQLVRQLAPGTLAGGACIKLPDHATKAATHSELAAVQFAGLAFSIALLLPFLWVEFMLAALPDGQLSHSVEALASSTLWRISELGVFLAAAGSVLSDLPGGPLLGLRPPLGCFCCGNWGLIVPRDALAEKNGGQTNELFPDLCARLLASILDVVELRGGQAGGFLSYLGEGGGRVFTMRSRTVKSKRGHLGQMIFQRFKKQLSYSYWGRFLSTRRLRPLPVVLAQGHSRFGTSSSPAENETHPHQWLGSQQETVWRCELSSGRWFKEDATVCVTITHNGDFDAWELYGSMVPNGTLGEWLARVMHHRNTAKGDSPKLAGVMDLLVCQGRWVASVRYAFVHDVMQHINQATGWEPLVPEVSTNAVPQMTFFEELAGLLDRTFAEMLDARPEFAPTQEGIVALAAVAFESLKNGMSKGTQNELQTWEVTDEIFQAFCTSACTVFFTHDLLSAVSECLHRAEGSFGVSASCSLWPTSIVLAAKGQPISLAFNMEMPIALWSSEPSSLTVSWPSPSSNSGALRVATARWDIDDAVGEAVELRVFDKFSAKHHVNLWAQYKNPGQLHEALFFATPDIDSDRERQHHILVRGTSLAHAGPPKGLSPSQFKGRWVRLHCPPFKIFKQTRTLDPIAADLKEVPIVLSNIENAWTDRFSLNYQSGQRFTQCLLSLLEKRRAGDSTVDVLIFGVENSLWLGQQFAADLKRVFPRLNILAMSSNWVLGMLQTAQGHIEPRNFTIGASSFALTPGAIVLALSHSGTTYPTVWAARLACRQSVPVNGFAMSADFDTVLANSIGQDLTQPTFTGALFSTMAGVRPAEPSTLATLAMHHTLSWLLLSCSRWAAQAFEPCATDDVTHKPCELTTTDVNDFQRVLSSFLPAAEQICGVSRHGQPVASNIRKSLLQDARYLASHLVEGWYCTFLMCTYVYVTVTFHVPLFSSLWSMLAGYLGMEGDSDAAVLIKYIVGHLDAHLYVFLAVLLAVAHRFVCGRRLWTRFTARTFVVVDCTVNYKLLRAYGSKLGALAFPFTGFSVVGQNGEDHFVHEMTHLAQSNAILLVGRPDGRLGSLAASEAAVIMSTQQARYICSRPMRGVEALSVGHNPWAKEGLFRRQLVLPADSRPLFMSQKLLTTEHGAHAPGDVVQKAGALMAYATTASSAAGPTVEHFAWMNMESLKELLLKRGLDFNSISFEDSEALLVELVMKNQDILGIDANDFVVAIVSEHMRTGSTMPSTPHAMSRFSTSLTKGVSTIVDIIDSTRLNPSNRWKPKRKQSLFSNGACTASCFLAALRGRKMRDHIHELQIKYQSAEIKKRVGAKVTRSNNGEETVRTCFDAWASLSVQSLIVATATNDKQAQEGSGLHTAAWRVREEYRRRRRQWLQCYQRSGIAELCFAQWRELITEGVRVIVVGAVAEGSELAGLKQVPVGGHGGQGSGVDKEWLNDLRLLEHLYETRVAAAERLLAMYVLLHGAVKPISRLWWLSYDMDRTESRLRVASTPAPVPFVEALPARLRCSM
mmetsp:Transcript_112402/g.357267  ORF Transcript_112402/g.357267 Transcript_112402/m.357267 type:complete len:1621 (+) Transcript_112402:48-4910(+)